MRTAMSCKSKSVGLIAKDDEEKAIRCICNLFKSVALYFDTNLTQSKAEVIATEILYKYEYRNLKLEDLVVICIRLKEAEIYKLSPARILREIKSYVQEREALAIKNSKEGKVNMNEDLEQRLKKSYYLPPNANKLEAKRLRIEHQFKK
tara:strand:+ start:376 stop:822 length:447 start_codon:yes stop_codon:yes gene_type:complete